MEVKTAPAASRAMTAFGKVGVLMGGVVRLVFGSIVLAGELIGSQIGHGAALQYDPTLQLSQGPLATLSGLLASLVFVGANLHLQVVQALGHSVEVVGPGMVADLNGPAAVWVSMALIFLGLFLLFPLIDMGSRDKVVPYGLGMQAQPAAAQKAAVDNAVTQKPSAIIIGSVDNRVWKDTIANAKAAGIPILAIGAGARSLSCRSSGPP